MITKILQTAVSGSLFGFKKPVHLILHVTSRCNSRCGMCFAWKRLNRDDDLTFEEIKKIAKTLNNLVFLDISGGEPFLREDLDEILKIFEEESPNAYVNLPTNCLLPEKIEKKTAQILQKTNLAISLNLSLDGLKKTHDSLRGVAGGFEKVIETYQRLKKLKDKNRQLSLKVSTVVSNQNFNEIEKLADFVKQEMPAVDFHTLILVRGDPPDKRFALPPLKDLEAKKEIFSKIWQGYRFGKNLGALGGKVGNLSHRLFLNLYLKTLKDGKMAVPCLAGKAHVVVFANGDLAFCELRRPIGNLRKVSFDFWKLWNSGEAEKQRAEIKADSCFCAHGCNWTDNVFLNPKTYPYLLWTSLNSFV